MEDMPNSAETIEKLARDSEQLALLKKLIRKAQTEEDLKRLKETLQILDEE